MYITKPISTEQDTPTTAGTASSISSATCVRLFNNQAGIVTVGISTQVGAATTISFSIPASYVEYLQKSGSDVIYSTSAIKATKVAFTH